MKRILKIGAIAVAILFVIMVALPSLINANSFRPKIESELTSALGRQVTVGNLSLSILSRSVVADNIAIADDPPSASRPSLRRSRLRLAWN
jgi:AsmA protein